MSITETIVVAVAALIGGAVTIGTIALLVTRRDDDD